jgi:predicted nicotinamide N-methyase
MDDFLWDCALDHKREGRFDIIPNYEDDMSHFGKPEDVPCVTTFDIPRCNLADDAMSSLEIAIIESRDNGVLDIIGGELWEGALLLCALILLHPNTFVDFDVLELGSGVGLPGLLVAALKVRTNLRGGVTLTDNDVRVVGSLNAAIAMHFSHPPSLAVAVTVTATTTRIQTRIMDWSIFMGNNGTGPTGNNDNGVSEAAKQVLQETAGSCEVIMGCELCYAPYHARCLAELLR